MGVLEVLGLTDLEESVYEALTRVPSATASELGRSTGLPARSVGAALRALEGHGLAVGLVGSEGRFTVTPPEPALDALVHAHQQALARVRSHGQQLAQQVRQITELRRPGDLVAVVVGSEQVNSHFEQLQREATREVLAFDRPPYPRSGGTSTNPLTVERMAAGVTYRTLYDRSLLEVPDIFERVLAEVARGEHGRVLSDIPLKLAIADRTMGLVPLLDADETTDQAALLIRPSVLLDSLAELFEALWQRGVPLRPGIAATEVGDSDPDLRRIVALLAAGMTDDSIARRLGISERTVRRKIAAAMQALGAETRFQAGMRAQSLGWLP